MTALALLVLLAPAQDARKWGEAVAVYQKFSASKDPLERARAAAELGNATFEKSDKMCWALVSQLLRQELGRDPQGRFEERISNDVLEACVAALRRITSKSVLADMAKVARNKGELPRARVYIIYGLAPNAELKDLAELIDDKIPHVQIAAVDAMAEFGDKSCLETLFKVARDEKRPWEAKLIALQGIGSRVDDSCGDPLIEMLGKVQGDEGRLKDEILKILRKLVRVEMATDDPNAWKAAWTTRKAGQDPEQPPEGATVVETADFFGLKTRSTRIMFILDRTGSMQAPLNPALAEPRKRPPTATSSKKDPPQELGARAEAERIRKKYDDLKVGTRMDALKREFIGTICSLDRNVWFGVVWYEGNPQPWRDHLLPATWPNKLEIIRETDRLNASGGTNIWGGLEYAFKIVGRGEGMQLDKKANYATLSAGADTYFLMTDGSHNTGKFVNEKARTPLESCDAAAFLGELRKVNKLRKVTIHTVCLGSLAESPEMAPDPVFMKKLSEETGGEFVHIKG